MMIGSRRGVDLVYNIPRASLRGRIGNFEVNAVAVAGGRAGSKQVGVVHPILANNPFLTFVKYYESLPDSVGGPLPVGVYRLKIHETRRNWIRLIPLAGTNMIGRNNMAIHWRGQRGSDGCIVPTDFNVVLSMAKALRKIEEEGGKAPTLAVIAQSADLDRYMAFLRLV